jgi:glycosyltransferase involved in cell wall biosynthesis
MSGIYLEAAEFAKRRYGAQIWIERGSRHILSQDEILAAFPGAERPSPDTVRRELAGYALADRIVIPSTHVEDSFARDKGAHLKLFRNIYGVDLDLFPNKTHGILYGDVKLLFVGTWCLRKGCDILTIALSRISNVRLTHIGALGDCAFPADDARFIHIDPVPERSLAQFYAQADLFVLASREDGTGLVLAQALAAGLPIVCTDRTGGVDLAHSPALAARITIVPHDDAASLAEALVMWRNRLRADWHLPPLARSDRNLLSWSAYGQRYAVELERTVGAIL